MSIFSTGSAHDEKELLLIFNADSLLLDVGCDIGKCFNLLTGGLLEAKDFFFFSSIHSSQTVSHIRALWAIKIILK